MSLRALTSTGIDWARATGERTAGIPRAHVANVTSLESIQLDLGGDGGTASTVSPLPRRPPRPRAHYDSAAAGVTRAGREDSLSRPDWR